MSKIISETPDYIPQKKFLSEKLHNFNIFLQQQIKECPPETGITNKHIELINNEFNKYNIDLFISSMSLIRDFDIDDTLNIFIGKYGINMVNLKPYIDYDKFKRYILCFLEATE